MGGRGGASSFPRKGDLILDKDGIPTKENYMFVKNDLSNLKGSNDEILLAEKSRMDLITSLQVSIFSEGFTEWFDYYNVAKNGSKAIKEDLEPDRVRQERVIQTGKGGLFAGSEYSFRLNQYKDLARRMNRLKNLTRNETSAKFWNDHSEGYKARKLTNYVIDGKKYKD